MHDPISYTTLLQDITATSPPRPERILLMGASGRGKSTLSGDIARALDRRADALPIYLLHTDPGRVLEGSPPGALTLARWQHEGWHTLHMHHLASLDALRFRTALLGGARELMARIPEQDTCHILIDTPGVLRGAIAAELLLGLWQVLTAARCILLYKKESEIKNLQSIDALEAHGVKPLLVHAHPMARRPSKSTIHAQRMLQWQTYLTPCAVTTSLCRHPLAIHHIVPPQDHDEASAGHFAVAFDAQGSQLGLVCCVAKVETITCHHPPSLDPQAIHGLFFRDMFLVPASEGSSGAPLLIQTHTSQAHMQRTAVRNQNQNDGSTLAYTPRERPVHRVNFAGSNIRSGQGMQPTMVGHLFEDPMFVLRLAHRQRCIFLDLGEVRQVPTRLIHQTTDILLSHAHLDHFGDFPWLLRRMAGHAQAIRIHGPPGTIARVANMVFAFTWDRVGDRGPKFEVHEIFANRVERAHVQARMPEEIERLPPLARAPDGPIRQEPRQLIYATTLDHGGLESIAYRIEEPYKFGVKGNILKERGWPPREWLGELKMLASQRRFEEVVEVPTRTAGSVTRSVRELHDEILIPQPGQKIVYATDFSTSLANHRKLVAFARDADLLICEASFAERDRDQAIRTGHMCARNTARIARDADVGLLAPFHFSVRYESAPEEIYGEILTIFDRVLLPTELLDRIKMKHRGQGEEE